jgi:MFS superfamily sulfate permease-like transporter
MITKHAFIREWLFNPRLEILSGIVVALPLIPEAIGFSVVAGVDPKVGCTLPSSSRASSPSRAVVPR